MRRIVHLSDIHFGKVDYRTVQPLIQIVNDLSPDVVVVSGDLTQRARRSQFKEARAFLHALPRPQVVIPGNHDLPLFNLPARLLFPFSGYKKYISDNLSPYYADNEIIVAGINTARSFPVTNGRINAKQIEHLRQLLCADSNSNQCGNGMPGENERLKVVVTHHPFELAEENAWRNIVGRAHMAMEVLAKCGADLLLGGHMHTGYLGFSATRYKISGHSALIVQAGTATSMRVRGEPNSFNLLTCENNRVQVEQIVWEPETGAFSSTSTDTFYRTENGWSREAPNTSLIKPATVYSN